MCEHEKTVYFLNKFWLFFFKYYLRLFEIETIFKLVNVEIRTKEHAFTLESKIYPCSLDKNSDEFEIIHKGNNFLFRLNLDKNFIKKQCHELTGECNQTNFELLLFDLQGNILKQNFRFESIQGSWYFTNLKDFYSKRKKYC